MADGEYDITGKPLSNPSAALESNAALESQSHERRSSTDESTTQLKAELRRRIREFAASPRDSFDAFDVNGDGVISRTEFKEALVLLGMDVTDSERKRLRQQIDTTPDKKISFEDFQAFCQGTASW